MELVYSYVQWTTSTLAEIQQIFLSLGRQKTIAHFQNVISWRWFSLALETSELLERGLKRRTYIFSDVKFQLYIIY